MNEGRPGGRSHFVAHRCRSQAEQRDGESREALETALADRGWHAECWSRADEKRDSAHWPPSKTAVLIRIEDFETDAGYLEDSFSLAAQHLGERSDYRVVPVINGVVAPDLAMRPSTPVPLPDDSFGDEWRHIIGRPFLVASLPKTFESAYAACLRISALINIRDLSDLHPEEDQKLSAEIRSFEAGRSIIAAAAEQSDSDHLILALDFLESSWNEVIDEYESLKDGRVAETPFCSDPFLALAGQASERASLAGMITMLLQQTECYLVDAV